MIAAAASTVEDDRCVEALRDAHVVWLRASPETLARRIARQTHRRDLGPDPVTTLGALEQARAARYAHVADLTVDVDHSTPTRTVDEILTALAPFPTRGDPR